MSKQNPNQLAFPNGRSVKRAKQDAKKRVREQKIPLNQALDQIAAEYGNFSTWEKAMTQLGKKDPVTEYFEPEVMPANFDQWLERSVMGEEDSILEGMTQVLDPSMRESLKSLHYEGFPEEILADFAHQMSKD